MRAAFRVIGTTVLVLLLALPLLAQGGRPSGGSASSGSSGGSAVSSGGDRGSAGGVSTYSGSYSAPSRIGGGEMYGGAGGGAVSVYVPRYSPYSSFNDGNYYQYLRFNNWLVNRFSWFQLMQLGLWDMNSRFSRNREPLLTPELAKLTLQMPLLASEQMLANVEALQAMIEDLQAGKPVNKADIEAKTAAIRAQAKKIRQYEALSFFDVRKEQDVTKGADKLGLGAIEQLRQMATELNSQLRNLYEAKATSTVSVNNLSEASFQSLSKGIEKLSKVIENAKTRT